MNTPLHLPLLRQSPSLKGKRVLLRLDLNLPFDQGGVTDAFRLDRVAKTLSFLQENGAKTLVVGHLENKDTTTPESLWPVFDVFRLRVSAVFVKNFEEAKQVLDTCAEGSFVMLENIRTWQGEKKNDPDFSKQLASLVDIYVNDAFSVSHREHASIIGVASLLPHYAGFLLEEEVVALSRSFTPAHPALVILGGSKFETKMPLVKRFIDIADKVVLCGALSNDIYKLRGYETGTSLVSRKSLDLRGIADNPKLYVPVDVTALVGEEVVGKAVDSLEATERIVDIGTESLNDLREEIKKAAFVLWNGPLGEYENGFDKGTIAIAQMIAESDAESIIGGGDSLVLISKLRLIERFSFVSTGGGAMLEFLTDGTLPGIEALLPPSVIPVETGIQ